MRVSNHDFSLNGEGKIVRRVLRKREEEEGKRDEEEERRGRRRKKEPHNADSILSAH